MSRLKVIIAAMLLTCGVSAQPDLEHILNSPDFSEIGVEEIETIRDELTAFHDRPMSIQQKNPSVLMAHPLITPIQAINISYYIERTGYIMDWGEMTDIDGIDPEWIERSKPFLTLEVPEYNRSKRLRISAIHGLRISAPRRSGFSSGRFEGPRFQEQARWSVQYGNTSAGLRWQKDEGEPYDLKTGLWDHLTGFVSLAQRKMRSAVHIGSYRVGFGCGVLAGTSFASGITNQASGLHRKSSSMKPSAPGSEWGNWTGLMLEKHFQSWMFRFAAGRSLRDTRIEDGEIRSFITTGTHRTRKEISTRKNTLLRRYTFQTHFRQPTFILSGHSDLIRFEIPYRGRLWGGGNSLHLQWLKHTLHGQAEWAAGLDGGVAVLHSLTRSAGDYRLGIRHYYQSPRFQPTIEAAGGILFSTGSQQSLEGIWSGSYRDLEFALTIYRGRKRDDWSFADRSGIQTFIRYRKGKTDQQYRWRWNRSDNGATLYMKNEWSRTISPWSFRIRVDLHTTGLRLPSVLLQPDLSAITGRWTLRFRFRIYDMGKDGLPLYAITRSTSLQMKILRMSGRGSGGEIFIRYRDGQGPAISMAFHLDNRPYLNFRGSGDDRTEGGLRWEWTWEIQWKLDQ